MYFLFTVFSIFIEIIVIYNMHIIIYLSVIYN